MHSNESSPSFVSEFNGYDFSSIFFFPPNPPPLLDDSDEYASISTTSEPILKSASPHQAPPHHKHLVDRHITLLSLLREVSMQAQALHLENINLKMVNVELNNRLSLVLNTEASCRGLKENSDSIVDGLRNARIGGCEPDLHSFRGPPYDDMAADGSGGNFNRVLLPKSISVRSTGYLKTVQGARRSRRRQSVYVNGGKCNEQPLEIKVYNQGMFKTELCHKWQQTGTCPYEHTCRFAHGIEELRPVIRHPRYKTEACRMVLNGEPCPYGHRCHFRHGLTDQEKLIKSIKTCPS